jgi:hypothetical protein
LSGPKFNNQHQTYVPGAVALLKDLKELDSVKKILLGEISAARAGIPKARIRLTNGNLIEIVFRDRLAVQVIRTITYDLYAVQAIVSKYSRTGKTKKKRKLAKKLGPKPKRRKEKQCKRYATDSLTVQTLGDAFPDLVKLKA